MAEEAPDTAAATGARIEAAIARIEAAVKVQAASAEALSRRHAALKSRMAEAVSALDEVIAREPGRLMAEVMLSIGGRGHAVGCRDGEEARLRELAAMLDERWPMAQRAAGNAGGERAMLFVALMLADDLDESRRRPPVGAAVSDSELVRIAERLERLASALEQPPLSA